MNFAGCRPPVLGHRRHVACIGMWRDLLSYPKLRRRAWAESVFEGTRDDLTDMVLHYARLGRAALRMAACKISTRSRGVFDGKTMAEPPRRNGVIQRQHVSLSIRFSERLEFWQVSKAGMGVSLGRFQHGMKVDESFVEPFRHALHDGGDQA